MISYIKKKLNIGINKVIENINICKSFIKILDNLLFETKPHEEILVKARFTESSNLRSARVYKNITKIVEKK